MIDDKVNSVSVSASKDQMTGFWKDHAKEASLAEMMLDSNAHKISAADVKFITSLLPTWGNYDIIEIGAGIGRYTAVLAPEANRFVAVDFMEKFVATNKKTNGHLPNVTFLTADARDLLFDELSFNLVFTNWLLMYLNDEEVKCLMWKIMSWLRPGGYFFFRESCFRQSGNADRTSGNPTHYRSLIEYDRLLETISLVTSEGKYRFEICVCLSNDIYWSAKDNPNQLCWLVRKVIDNEEVHGFASEQRFLDNIVYPEMKLPLYRWLSSVTTPQRRVPPLPHSLTAESLVLEAGCGGGDDVFKLAQLTPAHLVGCDLSANNIQIALGELETAHRHRKNVSFQQSDLLTRNYDHSFDVIHSRSTVHYLLADATVLFDNFAHWLKPGGQLLLQDYVSMEGGRATLLYGKRECRLSRVSELEVLLLAAGLRVVKQEDLTEDLKEIRRVELNFLTAASCNFPKKLIEEVIEEKQQTLKLASSGELKQVLLTLEKVEL